MADIKDKLFYNEASALKLGWEPSWLGENEFDEQLIEKIKQFQKENQLPSDGLLGPQTFKKLFTLREAKIALFQHQMNKKCPEETKKYIDIGFDNKRLEISWEKFVGMNEKNSLVLPPNTYKKMSNKRIPNMFIIHHDACLSSKSCYEVLKRRNLSAQFLIDSDGTIYQSVALNDKAYHAGSLGNVSFNALSIGVEVSNAVEIKYRQHYVNNGLGERPIVKKFKCHNKNYGDILGFYPEQIEALKVLIKTVCNYYNIPLQYPMDSKGNYIMGVSKECQEGKFKGVCCHYHLDKGKWDIAIPQEDMKKILEDIKSGK